MEVFMKTGAVKLRSHLDRYLLADDDREKVRQSRSRDSARSTWAVEPVEGRPHLIRLRSCHGTYLTASDAAFLLGVTGKKVVQSRPEHKQFEWSIEWEPVRDGFQVRIRSWSGKFLRANSATPPWRNTVTHNDSQSGTTRNWILWDVEAVEAGKFVEGYASSFSSLSYEGDDDLIHRTGGSGVYSPALSMSETGGVTREGVWCGTEGWVGCDWGSWGGDEGDGMVREEGVRVRAFAIGLGRANSPAQA